MNITKEQIEKAKNITNSLEKRLCQTEFTIYWMENASKFITALEEAQEEINKLNLAFNERNRVIEMQLKDKETLKEKLSHYEEALKFYKVAFDGGKLAREALEGECCNHKSDCAQHNGPAFIPTECDCGVEGECPNKEE